MRVANFCAAVCGGFAMVCLSILAWRTFIHPVSAFPITPPPSVSTNQAISGPLSAAQLKSLNPATRSYGKVYQKYEDAPVDTDYWINGLSQIDGMLYVLNTASVSATRDGSLDTHIRKTNNGPLVYYSSAPFVFVEDATWKSYSTLVVGAIK